MFLSFKKIGFAVAATLVTATSFVSAAISNDGHVQDGYAFDANCAPNCGPCPAYCGSSCSDFYFTAEGLVFKACQDGLAYGTHTRSTTLADTSVVVESRIKNVHPDWHVGFRLGVGYELPCDCWGIALYWTHFQTHANSHTNERFNPTTTPGLEASVFTPAYGLTSYNAGETSGIDRTEARWKLHLDLVDVELGRPVCLSQCLTIRPHIGIRAAWINQRYNIENTAITTTSTVDLQAVKLKSDYEGVGLRGGLDTQWDLGCGMSLYGNAAASVLYGNFNVKSEDAYRTDTTDTAFTFVDQKDDFCACRAVTDAAIGVRWRGCFCNDSVAVTLNVGWEHHLFFNQNQFEDFAQLDAVPTFNPVIGEIKNPQRYHGDLCLKGVTFGARIDF